MYSNNSQCDKFFLLITSVLLGFAQTPCQAQITLDGTLGPKGSLSGPNFEIPAEVGRQVGGNLFHSFDQFNIHTDESATFTGPGSIENILGRITGGERSTIDGWLRSEIPGANLFLINPAGMLFGPNAQLDVQGSFHATTADSIQLGEVGRFDATQPENSVLTAAPPSAFGFLGGNPAGISIQGSTLAVPTGESLSLIGGEIQISGGNLSAPDGRIDMVSVSSKGEVISNFQKHQEDINTDSFDQFGTITVSDRTTINVKGQGGGIFIRSGAFILENNSQINSSTEEGSNIGSGPNISLAADFVELNNSAEINSTTGPQSENQGGSISIDAEKVFMANNAKVNSRTSSTGSGNGGNILINSDMLILRGGAIIRSWSFGENNGGMISIKVVDSVLISGEDSGLLV
ncbi:MAG: filamentous hemagglutinin N-terminal domain-containing protein [Candidatus Competibacteraceae bacterium]